MTVPEGTSPAELHISTLGDALAGLHISIHGDALAELHISIQGDEFKVAFDSMHYSFQVVFLTLILGWQHRDEGKQGPGKNPSSLKTGRFRAKALDLGVVGIYNPNKSI